MNKTSPIEPIIFISYSHDSEEHKNWVRGLAESLRKCGVDVILDQWEISPGDDIPKFMEQSVKRSSFVVMICTEPYIRKVDDGMGGAGYEAMVVTGELITNLGTRKFIPVMRQSANNKLLPACISSRCFVDFSDNDDFNTKLEELVRSIHNTPQFKKPPLGKNPYNIDNSTKEKNTETKNPTPVETPINCYNLSLSYADAGDFVKWQQHTHQQKALVIGRILSWKNNYESSFPKLAKDLPIYFLPAISAYAELFATAFGAIDSKNNKFHNQLSLLDWIRNPKEWPLGGTEGIIELPDLALFAYQALLGALSLTRQLPEITYRLALTPLENKYSINDSLPLYKTTWAMGWPIAMNGTCTIAWSFLMELINEWKWLYELFGSREDTISAVIAYYLFLNVIDFLSATKNKEKDIDELRELIVPLCFFTSEHEIQTHAANILFNSSKLISELISTNGVSINALPDLWNLWMQSCSKWSTNVYRNYLIGSRSLKIPHWNLPTRLSHEISRPLIE
ncbi:MAG: toll/interleukin-1 receptor domain-containing protein [Chthoniobacterales bacterium]